MSNFNKVPELLEINLGFPDFRFKCNEIQNLPFSQVETLLKALPKEIKNVGIGGSPLRFNWWKDFVDLLSILDKNIILVEKVSQINISKMHFTKQKGIKFVLEVENLNQVRKGLKFKNDCEIFLISLGNASKDRKLLDFLKKAGISFNIEAITWGSNRVETKRIKQFLEWWGEVDSKCGIITNKVIGLGIDGNFYPCVALQFPEFKLGSIFRDDFSEIVKSYSRFKEKLICQYCCQARSWSKYKVLNRDFLCFVCAEKHK